MKIGWSDFFRLTKFNHQQGVNFFLIASYEHYDVLAWELANHNICGGLGKLLHLMATPRCAFPDDRTCDK
jgi:hypothetical protein